jgi:hypothetical protein
MFGAYPFATRPFASSPYASNVIASVSGGGDFGAERKRKQRHTARINGRLVEFSSKAKAIAALEAYERSQAPQIVVEKSPVKHLFKVSTALTDKEIAQLKAQVAAEQAIIAAAQDEEDIATILMLI